MNNKLGKKINETSSNSNAGPVSYELKVLGHLDQVWTKWFEGMALTHTIDDETGTAITLISGPVVDQPALHGLLTKIRDLNLILISVRRINPATNAIEELSIKPEPPGD